MLGRPQIVALTATATPEVRADIATQLGLGDARHFIAGFDRPNLSLRVLHTAKERDKLRHAARIAVESEGAGIVYAATRKAVETLADKLSHSGVRAVCNHSRNADDEQLRALARNRGVIQLVAFATYVKCDPVRDSLRTAATAALNAEFGVVITAGGRGGGGGGGGRGAGGGGGGGGVACR